MLTLSLGNLQPNTEEVQTDKANKRWFLSLIESSYHGKTLNSKQAELVNNYVSWVGKEDKSGPAFTVPSLGEIVDSYVYNLLDFINQKPLSAHEILELLVIGLDFFLSEYEKKDLIQKLTMEKIDLFEASELIKMLFIRAVYTLDLKMGSFHKTMKLYGVSSWQKMVWKYFKLPPVLSGEQAKNIDLIFRTIKDARELLIKGDRVPTL